MIREAEAAARTAAEVEDFLAGGHADASRVSLRPLTADDQDEFLDLVAASTDLHHPWMSLPATPQEFRAYLGRFDHSTAQSLLVCLRDGGAIAGMVNIHDIIRGRFQSGSLAYAGFAPAAGRGYMSEGLALVVNYAFTQVRLHRLEASIQPGNRASLDLVRRLGFRREGHSPAMLFIDGVWEDHERWAITNSPFAPPHPTLPAR